MNDTFMTAHVIIGIIFFGILKAFEAKRGYLKHHPSDERPYMFALMSFFWPISSIYFIANGITRLFLYLINTKNK